MIETTRQRISWLFLHGQPIATVTTCLACYAEWAVWNKGDSPLRSERRRCPSCKREIVASFFTNEDLD